MMCSDVTSGPRATSNISADRERRGRGEGAHWLSATSPSRHRVNPTDMTRNLWIISQMSKGKRSIYLTTNELKYQHYFILYLYVMQLQVID